MNLELFLKGLAEVAKSPLAFVAYIIVAIGWLSILWKESRIKSISKALNLLPKDKRLEALKLEYKLTPPEGLSANQFLKLQKRNMIFLAVFITIIAGLVVATMTIYRYIQLDRNNVAGESMRTAYEAFIRGTTTADNNRFHSAIGKMEESLRIRPSYSGYINLADIYEEVGDVERALWASRKAQELDPSNPSPRLNIGMFLKDKGELEEAEKNLLEAQRLFSNRGIVDDEFQVAILVNLGNIYYEKADAAKDENEKQAWAKKSIDEYYGKALLLRGGIQDERFLANLLGNAANAYRITGDYAKAENYISESISRKEKLAKSSTAWSSLGIGYYNLGQIHLAAGKKDQAKTQFERSEKIFREGSHAIGLGSVHLSYGEMAFTEGDKALARDEWTEAKSIFSANSLDLYVQKAKEKLDTLD